MPTAFRNALEKYIPSSYPAERATAPMERSVEASRFFALLIRQRIRYSAGVIPSSDLKSLKRVIRVISAASAISSAEMGRG